MSRALSDELVAVVGIENVVLVHFIDLDFTSGTVRVCTAPVDLTLAGLVYTGIGGVLSFDGFGEGVDMAASGAEMKLSGVDQSILVALLAEGFIGRRVRVRACYFPLAANLIANSGAETDTVGATAAAATVTRVLTDSWEGVAAFQIVTTNVADSGVTFDQDGTNWITVIPGATYMFAFYTRVTSVGAVPMKAYLNFFASQGGAFISASTPVTVSVDPALDWQRVVCFATCPATATRARALFATQGISGVDTLLVDGVMCALGALEVPYQPTRGTVWFSDAFVAFSGYMNGQWEIGESRDDATRGGTVDISSRVLAPLASIRQPRGIMTNLDTHQRFYPGGQALGSGDLFFAFVPTLAGKHIEWGFKKKIDGVGVLANRANRIDWKGNK